MRPSREPFWRQVARDFDTLNVALLQDETVSMEKGEREYLSFQKKLLRQAKTEWERQHLRRLVAHSLLRFAYSTATTWAQYAKALRRLRRLDYVDVDYQSRAASFTLLWVADHDPARASVGWSLVEDAERRLRRMRRKSPVRKQALAAIAHVRQHVAVKGLAPPAPPSASKTTRPPAVPRETPLRSRGPFPRGPRVSSRA